MKKLLFLILCVMGLTVKLDAVARAVSKKTCVDKSMGTSLEGSANYKMNVKNGVPQEEACKRAGGKLS